MSGPPVPAAVAGEQDDPSEVAACLPARRPHVRLVTWDDEPPVGGQGVYARELRQALSRRGLPVSTLAGHGPAALRYRRVTGRGHLDMSLELARRPAVLLREGPDLLHLSGGPGGLQLLRTVPVPVVFTAHHTYRLAHLRTSFRRAVGLLEAASYRRAARVAAVSPSTADSVRAMGVPADKVVVVSPGVRVDESRTPAEVVAAPEREAGRLLFVGRLEPEKGPLDAVAVMRLVRRRLPEARGCVIGTGSLAGEVALSVAEDEGIEVLGRVGDEELECQYRRASVVLVPSAYEGLGIVALEAMGQGAAVVGYDVVGLRDTIGEYGHLVPAGDVRAMASAALEVLGDDGGRHRRAASALAMVRRERSWACTASAFETLYLDLLGQG